MHDNFYQTCLFVFVVVVFFNSVSYVKAYMKLTGKATP